MKIKISRWIVCVFLKIYEALIVCYVRLRSPWLKAKFYTAWEYYQHDDVYRERLMNFGFRDAVKWFLDNKTSINYCFKKELERHPELKWRIMFLPWTIERPDIFDIAVSSGISDYSK